MIDANLSPLKRRVQNQIDTKAKKAAKGLEGTEKVIIFQVALKRD